MRKLIKWICSLAVIIATSFLSMNIASAVEYEVIFRAGNRGSFEDGSTKIVKNIEAGEGFPDIPDIVIEEGYMFTGWNKEIPAVVNKRIDFVAQYKQLINGKEYAISYVDTFGNPLATKRVLMGELGDSIQVRAKVIDGYIVDAIEKTLVIQESNNEIIFTYTSTTSDVIYNDVIVTVPGTTTPLTPGGTTTPGDEAETPTTPDVEQVPEEETPLNKEEVDEKVEEEETPLNKGNENSFVTPALALGAGVVLGLLILMLLKKRAKKDQVG